MGREKKGRGEGMESEGEGREGKEDEEVREWRKVRMEYAICIIYS